MSEDEKNGLLKAFIRFLYGMRKEPLLIEKDVEDIHSQIEKEMSSILGTTGKKYIPDGQERPGIG